MTINLYTPPKAQVSDLDAVATIDIVEGLSLAEISAFTGKGEYPKQLLQYHNKQKNNAGFNGWAAIFGVQWFVYRKLYAYLFIAFVIEVAPPFLLWIITSALPEIRSKEIIVGSIFFAIVASRILLGYFANIALYWKAEKTIRQIDSLNLDNEMHLRLITQEGGVCFPALILLYVGFGVIRIAIEIAL